MSEEWLIFEFLELDQEDDSNMTKRVFRRGVREKNDPFSDLQDDDFIKKYRLSKELAKNLCDEMRPMFKAPKKSSDLSVETKVLTALLFYANGSHQKPTGDIGAHCLAQQTVSQVITEVTACLNSPEVINKYIKFPQTPEERNTIRSRFHEKFNFPGVLGCVDSTHIAIIKPAEKDQDFYCHANRCYSLNVQLVCDADGQIINVDSTFGGANENFFIWDVHYLRGYMERLNEETWLLGGSGYPLRRYMLTPVIYDASDTAEQYYTEVHYRTRNTIKMAIAHLKARFNCLLSHKVLHYQPWKAAHIVNACVILHNICNKARLPVPELSDKDLFLDCQKQITEKEVACIHDSPDLQHGISTRNSVIRRLWDARAF